MRKFSLLTGLALITFLGTQSSAHANGPLFRFGFNMNLEVNIPNPFCYLCQGPGYGSGYYGGYPAPGYSTLPIYHHEHPYVQGYPQQDYAHQVRTTPRNANITYPVSYSSFNFGR